MPLHCLFANHHTPYWTLVATALPDVTFLAAPTAHAPDGWRPDQRPQPPNVTIARGPVIPSGYNVVVAQTRADYEAYLSGGGLGLDGRNQPVLYLSHNHARVEAIEPARLHDRRAPLACISPMKAQSWRDAGYEHPITVIEPGIDVESMPPWEGTEPVILSVVNGLTRPLFDLDSWLAVTKGLPVRVVGEGNDGLPGAVGPAASWDALQDEYRRARVYLNPTAPPYEDMDNLASIEARATGMPIFSLHGWHRQPAPATITAARERLQAALDGTRPLAPSVRAAVAEQWSLERFGQQWRTVLEEGAGRG